jgi:6-phosphofructokinase 2
MSRVVTLTLNPSIDLECEIERLIPHQKLRATEPSSAPGGGGINVARVATRLGGDAVAVYPAGGHRGELLPEMLAAEEVPDRPIEAEAETRENITIAESDTGKRFRLVLPGGALTETETKNCIETAINLVRPGDLLVASGSLPPGVPEDLYAGLARRAAEQRSRFVLDSSGEALRRALEAGVYLVKPNARELKEALGEEISTPDEVIDGARRLVSDGAAQIVVVSLADAGAVVATEGDVLRFQTPDVEMASPVGAGDSMVGALAFALADDGRDGSLESAARLAVAAGTAAVTTPGSDLCDPDDVWDLVERVETVT